MGSFFKSHLIMPYIWLFISFKNIYWPNNTATIKLLLRRTLILFIYNSA